jgi:toxin ParE1/3/4
MKRYEVVLSQLAEIDINEIISYYLQKNKDSALELYKRIKNRILELDNLPNKGRIVPELDKNGIHEFRELIEGNYRIVYSIHEMRVHILAVVDSRRNLDDILIKKVIDFYNKK